MRKEKLSIQGIPAVLWGEKSNKLLIAVHGNQSHKEDTVIAILAEKAVGKGWRMLSFDLPEHGERRDEGIPCKVQICVRELEAVMKYAKEIAGEIALFGCSMGAYFSMLAYRSEPLYQALLLSPVVDMERVIGNMMRWFDVSEERLKAEREIATPVGQTLYWDYYCYVKSHPIETWNVPTSILYGSDDELCEYDRVSDFAGRFRAGLRVMEHGEHFFHTGEQLECYRQWLREKIK